MTENNARNTQGNVLAQDALAKMAESLRPRHKKNIRAQITFEEVVNKSDTVFFLCRAIVKRKKGGRLYFDVPDYRYGGEQWIYLSEVPEAALHEVMAGVRSGEGYHVVVACNLLQPDEDKFFTLFHPTWAKPENVGWPKDYEPIDLKQIEKNILEELSEKAKEPSD